MGDACKMHAGSCKDTHGNRLRLFVVGPCQTAEQCPCSKQICRPSATLSDRNTLHVSHPEKGACQHASDIPQMIYKLMQLTS